ncbi:MAG TPA: tRNA pseudouridine(38-40) synthase TruA [Phycisphaerales bacterium]|nr:tRNA pseudouridine(38-40) synthase TruA [Phycisphaerales bacterium]HCD33404.1 tRNA pseudouridine(38-40) synthase TruA [Phycisphaerales bacterium]|tara:strand:+ start:93566 stop:94339 length:774 start_codon:yes stop_codon:yes gene_type:complete
MALQRYKLHIAYDGTNFHGWQQQILPSGQHLRTVQGELIKAMQRLFAQPINLLGASRTDTGVHAVGQVAHFDVDSPIPVERMAMAINGRMPADIEVRYAQAVDFTFDAIKRAKNKQYRYRIYCSKYKPLGIRHMVFHCKHNLDLDRMNDAAQRLIGTHDVEGLSAAGHGRLTTVRTIYECNVSQVGDEFQIIVQGSGFLYNMVRIIAGTLMEVGRGHFEPTVIDTILQTADRRHAGPTLKPQGLCLEWISYDEVSSS